MSREGIACKSRNLALVPTTFIWPHGGAQVLLCGSFTSWLTTLPMTPLENCPTVFQGTFNLPVGYHEYKFIVDGQWRWDHQGPVAHDLHGNVNNCVTVKIPELASSPNGDGGTSGSNMDVDQNSGHHMIDLQDGHQQPRPQAISAGEVETSKQRLAEFLLNHTAYELIPESGKVIVLDVMLPVKQAFHILYEQGLTVAPLWDSERQQFVGMLSASDFIIILRQLGNLGSMLSEEELDTHTIAVWKDEKSTFFRVRRQRHLISVGPDDSLRQLTDKLLMNEVATLPVLTHVAQDGFVPQVLHLATLSDILKCMLRHFRHVPSWLPLLLQPLYALPLGTWSPEVGGANCRPLAMLRASAPLSAAFSLLLQANVSALPILDDNGSLIDVYTRSDITSLARDRAYATVHLHEITVGQALQMGQDNNRTGGSSVGTRCHMCLRSHTLRDVIERLATPGVRRVICVEAGSRHVEGIISLRDVFRFLTS
ncbi:hypothetical protein SELMODRAFT_229585 [Selaginella moellendorffii]|uniref:CBS domain-containing protein n=1 Tax=Selaginella moellendorffii TaxID=88036 RepID=D8T658_SELML|nr:sucrose nonfermenting 4-like protein [Selaginella moellendorffii]EFJ07854.1 hypothetical protein SELMODRAFT_229585 [Selaginella moellendorffii]|eukprot:XP_002991046.1 sucrose nonfermenting 4-like protein [Selaginella moellendorffii]